MCPLEPLMNAILGNDIQSFHSMLAQLEKSDILQPFTAGNKLFILAISKPENTDFIEALLEKSENTLPENSLLELVVQTSCAEGWSQKIAFLRKRLEFDLNAGGVSWSDDTDGRYLLDCLIQLVKAEKMLADTVAAMISNLNLYNVSTFPLMSLSMFNPELYALIIKQRKANPETSLANIPLGKYGPPLMAVPRVDLSTGESVVLNLRYLYSSTDISSLLKLRVKSLAESAGCPINLPGLEDVHFGQIADDPSSLLNVVATEYRLAAEAGLKERWLIAHCHQGYDHWTGWAFKYDKRGELEWICYTNSINGQEPEPLLLKALQERYPKITLTYFYGIPQEDEDACGVLVVENLTLIVLNATKLEGAKTIADLRRLHANALGDDFKRRQAASDGRADMRQVAESNRKLARKKIMLEAVQVVMTNKQKLSEGNKLILEECFSYGEETDVSIYLTQIRSGFEILVSMLSEDEEMAFLEIVKTVFECSEELPLENINFTELAIKMEIDDLKLLAQEEIPEQEEPPKKPMNVEERREAPPLSAFEGPCLATFFGGKTPALPPGFVRNGPMEARDLSHPGFEGAMGGFGLGAAAMDDASSIKSKADRKSEEDKEVAGFMTGENPAFGGA
jgi:hypothetical protein